MNCLYQRNKEKIIDIENFSSWDNEAVGRTRKFIGSEHDF